MLTLTPVLLAGRVLIDPTIVITVLPPATDSQMAPSTPQAVSRNSFPDLEKFYQGALSKTPRDSPSGALLQLRFTLQFYARRDGRKQGLRDEGSAPFAH